MTRPIDYVLRLFSSEYIKFFLFRYPDMQITEKYLYSKKTGYDNASCTI